FSMNVFFIRRSLREGGLFCISRYGLIILRRQNLQSQYSLFLLQNVFPAFSLLLFPNPAPFRGCKITYSFLIHQIFFQIKKYFFLSPLILNIYSKNGRAKILSLFAFSKCFLSFC